MKLAGIIVAVVIALYVLWGLVLRVLGWGGSGA